MYIRQPQWLRYGKRAAVCWREQYFRRNLSAPINPNLMRVYNIAPYLQAGTNIIAVWARNYGSENKNLEPDGPARCAGFHLYGEVAAGTGEILQLLSDETWKVSKQEYPGWTQPGFDDAGWWSAQGNPDSSWKITYPDFIHERPGFWDRG